MSVGFFIHASSIYMCGGIYGAYLPTSYTAKTGYFYGLMKDNLGNIILQESFDELEWIDIVIYPHALNNTLNTCCDINGDGGKLSNPKIAASINIPFISDVLIFSGSNITNKNGVYRGANLGFGNLGIDTVNQLSSSGRIILKHTIKGVYGALGFVNSSSPVGYSQMLAGFFIYNNETNDNIMACGISVPGGFSLIESVGIGYFYCLFRDSSGNFLLQKSQDSISWTTIYTFSNTSVASLSPCCDIAGGSNEGVLAYPKFKY